MSVVEKNRQSGVCRKHQFLLYNFLCQRIIPLMCVPLLPLSLPDLEMTPRRLEDWIRATISPYMTDLLITFQCPAEDIV